MGSSIIPGVNGEKSNLSQLPKVDAVLNWARLFPEAARLARPTARLLAQEWVERQRQQLKEDPQLALDTEGWPASFRRFLLGQLDIGLCRVINATGILLHTNLGRAPLSASDFAELAARASGYCDLEWDRSESARGKRTAAVSRLVQLWLGRNDLAACFVNNNASAVLLALRALARGKSVLLSRGEIVQIGGGFRIPDILAESGAHLCEVGTTNITTVEDYRRAAQASVGAILKVHQSCYSITGHTESPSLKALGDLCQEFGVPLLFDLGSGNHEDFCWEEETLQGALAAGCDLVMFSGDKIIGGSQAGLLVGKKDLIATIEKTPLYRALRLGKLDVIYLEHTLRKKLMGELTPLEQLAGQTADSIDQRAKALLPTVQQLLPQAFLNSGESEMGGGSQARTSLPTTLIVIPVADPEFAARRLAQAPVPIIARKQKGAVQIDLRTVSVAEESDLVKGLACLS